MNKIIITGSAAAPGVPSITHGWGECDPLNKKNRRMRSGTYVEYEGLKFLIDTSPDLRMQLLDNNINDIDFVLYTHSHADHVHGIDDLRAINRLKRKSIDFYATRSTASDIKKSFSYLISRPVSRLTSNVLSPKLTPNVIKTNKAFYIKGVKIVPIKLLGHHAKSAGYVFDDGEFVFISDFKRLSSSAWKAIKVSPKLMVMPLTDNIKINPKHATLEELLGYIEKIKPEKVIINHMSTYTDYDDVNRTTPKNVYPAWDGMTVEF
jgi:phosphoribosyl 1,2-cyclic phosphate phosphodiesterase